MKEFYDKILKEVDEKHDELYDKIMAEDCQNSEDIYNFTQLGRVLRLLCELKEEVDSNGKLYLY